VQTTEAANRTAAALRWLDRSFTTAHRTHARSVVVVTQADMWDLDGKDVVQADPSRPTGMRCGDRHSR